MKEFDDIIRNKIEGLSTNESPQWSKMETRIQEESFDQLVRDELFTKKQKAAAVAPVMGWESLNSKLDQTPVTGEQMFDQLVSQKLASQNSPLDPEDSWRVLSHRIDTFWPLRRVMAKYRVLEIAAVIALLITFAPLLNDNFFQTSYGNQANTSSQQQTVVESTILSPSEIFDEQAYGNTSNASNILHSTGEGFSKSSLPFLTLESLGAFEHKTSLSSLSQGRTIFLNSQETSANNKGQLTASKQGEKVYIPLNTLGLEPLAFAKSPIPLVKLEQDASSWKVGPNVGFQFWRISAPGDAEFDHQGYSINETGFVFGLNAQKELNNKLAVHLGANFIPLRYSPELPKVQSRLDVSQGFPFNQSQEFKFIEINLAQLPVALSYNLTSEHKRLDLRVFTGVTSSFVLDTRYSIQTEIGIAPLARPSSEIEEEIVFSEDVYTDSKNFTPGFLQDPSFKRNSFLSASVGLKSNFKLNDKFDLSANVNYDHFLPIYGGFGPNQDRLNGLGLSLGVHYTL